MIENKMVKISAVIITFNEQNNIGRCIDSLKPVSDEIVVIDSFSKDLTKQICLAKGARFIEHAFHSHIEQKNFAVKQAAFDYILSLDADEYLSPELAQSILVVKEDWTASAYRMKRLSTYGGKWITHGDWYPDRKIRLLDRRIGRWEGYNPHDKIFLDDDVKIKLLKGDILHKAYENSYDTLCKIQRYSDIFAEEQKGRRKSSVLKILLRSSFAFFRSYFLRKGFLDGFEGLMVSAAVSNHVFYKYAKLYELNKGHEIMESHMTEEINLLKKELAKKKSPLVLPEGQPTV